MGHFNSLPQDAVFWGEGSLQKSLGKFAEFGIARPIIFSITFLEEMQKLHILPHLKDCVGIVTDLPAHAPDTGIRKALAECKRLGAGSIIAHGGGSVLDAAKAVSFMHFEETGRYLPVAALPTTLSGSEYAHYFGITETDGPQLFKRSYAVRDTTAKVVALDPVLLHDTPRQLLLSSAVKGIDHAIEGMRKTAVNHPHAIMAADGVHRFFSVLERWPKDLDTPQALDLDLVSADDLTQLQLAAWHCYFSPASVIYGLSHRIGHILGGTFELPHSLTSCITLAPVIRACNAIYEGRLGRFVDEKDQDNAANILADRIENLVLSLGLPNKIGGLGLDKSKLGEVSVLLKTNYPSEVGDLGDDAEDKLDSLLNSLW